MTTDEINLHDTTDAAVWASEFCKIWPSALCQAEGKEGVSDGDDWEATMIGWFANAIMAGVDSEARKNDNLASRVLELTEALEANKATWEDKEDKLTEAIKAADPANTGDYKTYHRALNLVSNRHSKYALVGLVNYLLAALKEPRDDVQTE